MSMVKKSISVTDQQSAWIKDQIEAGHYGNESEVIRELISERQVREQENSEDIDAIRTALIVGEESIARDGYSRKTADDIWEEAKATHKARHG